MQTMLRKEIVIRVSLSLLLAAFVFASSVSPARAEAEVFFQNYTVELNNLNVAVYCGVDGYGEMVYLNGTMHALFYEVHNAAGGVLYRSKVNAMNVIGTGGTTGATYQATGVGMGTSTVSDHEGYMSVDVMNLIGQGHNSKSVVQMVFHVGVDANGEETILVDHYQSTCR
jgi:hypothetical protein